MDTEEVYTSLIQDVRTIRAEWNKLRRKSREIAAWHRRLDEEALRLQRANEMERCRLLVLLCCCQI